MLKNTFKPKYEKYILTVAEPIKSELTVSFRDINTGENTAYSSVDWNHAFTIWPKLKQNVDLRFSRSTIRHASKSLRARIKKKIQEKIPDVEVREINRAFPTLQAYSPIKNKDILQELVNEVPLISYNNEYSPGNVTNLLSNEQKKFVDKAVVGLDDKISEKLIFESSIKIPTFYSSFIRQNFGEPGDIVEIDERYFQVLKEKKEIEVEIETLERSIRNLFSESKTKGTAHLNKLHGAFEKYVGDNFDEIKEVLESGKQTKALKDFWNERKQIADKIFTLDKKIEQINPGNLAIFNNRNNDKKSSSKDYCLDSVIASSDFIKSKRKMTGEELKAQKWIFIDIEKPKYDDPDEAISWVSLVYYENGKVVKKETHTIRDTGLTKKGDREILSYVKHGDQYKNYEDMIKELNKRITDFNPLVFSSYNLRYDAIETRDAANGAFGIGVENEEPRIKVSTKFFERIGIRGRLTYDMLRHAQMFLPHLPNKKLNLVAKYILGDEAFGKIINYDQQRELENITMYGSIKNRSKEVLKLIEKEAGIKLKEMSTKQIKMYSARVIEEYVSGDTDVLPKLLDSKWGIESFDLITKVCKLLDLSIEQFVTYGNLNKFHKKNYYEKVGIPYDWVYPLFNNSLLKINNNAAIRLKNLKNRLIKQKNKPGLHKNVYHVYVPLSSDFLDIYDLRENSKQKLEDFPREFKTPIEKYFYSKVIEGILKDTTIDFMEVRKAWNNYRKDSLTKIVSTNGFDRVYKKIINKVEEGRLTHIPQGVGLSEAELNSDVKDFNKLKNKGMRNKVLEAYIKYSDCFDDLEVLRFMKEADASLESMGMAVKLAMRKQNSKTLVSLSKKVKKFYGKLLKDPHDYENLFERDFKEINEFLDPEQIGNNTRSFSNKLTGSFEKTETFLKQNGFDVIYKNGHYLYLTGKDVDALKSMDAPVVLVDEIDSVYIDGATQSSQKIYYDKFGYWHGIKIKDHPDNNVSFYEMELFGGFLKDIKQADDTLEGFEKQKKVALGNIETRLQKLFNKELTNLDLANFVKSREVYRAYTLNKGVDASSKISRKKDFSSLEELNAATIDYSTYKEKILDNVELMLRPIIDYKRLGEIVKRDVVYRKYIKPKVSTKKKIREKSQLTLDF